MYEDMVSTLIAAKKKPNVSAEISADSPFNLERNAAATWHRSDGDKSLDTVMAKITSSEVAMFSNTFQGVF